MEEDNHGATRQLQLLVVSQLGNLPLLEQLVLVLDNHLVMVTEDSFDVPIESPEKTLELRELHEGKVTEVVNNVVWFDQLVPLLHHLVVHLIHIGIWTIGILDDVGVAPVSVTGKPMVHCHTSVYATLTCLPGYLP